MHKKFIIPALLVSILSLAFMLKVPNLIMAKYYGWLAHAQFTTKDYKGAITNYSKALSYDPSNTTLLISRGSSYVDFKKYEEAIVDYSEVIRLNPKDPRAYAYRGRAYYEQKDTTKSLEDYDKAISLDEKFGYECDL